MKNFFFPIAVMVTVLFIFSACKNSGNAIANPTDTLNTDSANISGKDNTAIPKDSGAMANAMPVDTADKVFLVKAISGSTFEITAGNMAADSGKSPGVKQFADMLIKDYTGANSNLRNIAKQLQVSIPDSIMAKHSNDEMALKKIKGVAFDKAYIKMMITDQKENIADFEKAAGSNNTLIKNFAVQTLPVLNKQLDSAKAIVKAIK